MGPQEYSFAKRVKNGKTKIVVSPAMAWGGWEVGVVYGRPHLRMALGRIYRHL